MTVEVMTEGVTDRSFRVVSNKNVLSRRDFLKLSGAALLGTGAFVISNSLLGEREEGLDPKIERLEDTLSEYRLGWQAKPWVWVNLALASQFLDGRVIKPGEEVSVLNLLRLDQMGGISRENDDPTKGYVAAQLGNIKKLEGWGYGLCLGSTVAFRAALNSPLEITERHTHYDAYPEYFEDFPVGTDAAIYYPDQGESIPKLDLKFRNPTDKDLRLAFRIYDSTGKRIGAPQQEISDFVYKASYLDRLARTIQGIIDYRTGVELPDQYFPQYMFGNKKIIARAAIMGDYRDYRVDLSPIKHGDSTFNPASNTQDYFFTRTLSLAKPNQELITERFVSNYGSSPLQNRVLGENQ